MDIPDKDKLYKDSDGTLRSKPLPRIAGTVIKLPARIDETGSLNEWQRRINDPSELITIDLFCGAGGLSLGFENAGFFVAVGIDRDSAAVETHGYNFLSKSIEGDISEIQDPEALFDEIGIPRVDVIVGGPPCQGFSRVGRGKLRSINLESYYHKVLNSLYKEFIRFVEIFKPKAFLMENVPDMATFNNGELVQRIIEKFSDLGYVAKPRVIDAIYHGVPQRRQRLFIQGNRLGLPMVWPAPNITESQIVTLKEAIGDLPKRKPPSVDEILPYNPDDMTAYQKLMRENMPEHQRDVVFDHIIRAVRDDDKIIFSIMKEGDKYSDIPEELRRYRSDIFKDKYAKLIWSEPSWTITAHIRKDAYRYIHPDPEQGRMLSIREFARLQSFPDHFRFCGAPTRRMQQIGNAVPPLLAESIADELYRQLCTHLEQDKTENDRHLNIEGPDERSA